MKSTELPDFIGNWTSQARKGFLELVVMSLLGTREYYGYELVEHIYASSGIGVADGTLYAILARLQKEELIWHRWEQPAKGPARKYYMLTRDGKAALKRMREVWADMAGAVEKFRGRNV